MTLVQSSRERLQSRNSADFSVDSTLMGLSLLSPGVPHSSNRHRTQSAECINLREDQNDGNCVSPPLPFRKLALQSSDSILHKGESLSPPLPPQGSFTSRIPRPRFLSSEMRANSEPAQRGLVLAPLVISQGPTLSDQQVSPLSMPQRTPLIISKGNTSNAEGQNFEISRGMSCESSSIVSGLSADDSNLDSPRWTQILSCRGNRGECNKIFKGKDDYEDNVCSSSFKENLQHTANDRSMKTIPIDSKLPPKKKSLVQNLPPSQKVKLSAHASLKERLFALSMSETHGSTECTATTASVGSSFGSQNYSSSISSRKGNRTPMRSRIEGMDAAKTSSPSNRSAYSHFSSSFAGSFTSSGRGESSSCHAPFHPNPQNHYFTKEIDDLVVGKLTYCPHPAIEQYRSSSSSSVGSLSKKSISLLTKKKRKKYLYRKGHSSLSTSLFSSQRRENKKTQEYDDNMHRTEDKEIQSLLNEEEEYLNDEAPIGQNDFIQRSKKKNVISEEIKFFVGKVVPSPFKTKGRTRKRSELALLERSNGCLT